MKRLFPLTIFLVALLLAACDPFKADQIREQAAADQMAAQSQQAALNAEQARQHAEAFHQIQMQDEARQQARKDALEPAWRFGWQLLIYTVFIVGAGMLVYSVVRVGHTTVVQLNRVQEGFATAMITAAELRSRLIYLDPATRQYPLIYQYSGHGRFLASDPNTKTTMELDTRNEGDAQMIAGAIAIRHSGVLAMEQRRSGARDAASIGLIQPPIIEGSAIDVKTVARDLVQRGWDDE